MIGTMNKNIAIVGTGAAGSICGYYLIKAGFDVTLFDKSSPLRTLLPTGGGRCNLAHAEYDFRELAKNYPRGEKFLYSIFSRFSTSETIELFEELGIKTYTQDDGRIFPDCNNAKLVREKILKRIDRHIVKEEVVDIKISSNGYKLKTNRAEYLFSHRILATGGHSGYSLAENLGLKIVSPHPSLVGLNTKEKFAELSGTVVKNCISEGFEDDLLFTHFGVSGPLIYKISSIKAFDNFPYQITINLSQNLKDFQEILNKNPHKEIKNILGMYLPQKFAKFVLKGIDESKKAHETDGKTRDLILERIHSFKINVVGTNKGEETVTAGGIDLNQINSKTMEVKKLPHLYCIGEVLNIDGFCGGYNLQNAWSTAFVAAESILTD